MSKQNQNSQYHQQRQDIASQILPRNNTTSSVGQSSQEAMAQLASQVQATIGVNPIANTNSFCGVSVPSQDASTAHYTPIQPALSPRQFISVGGLDGLQYWNNSSQGTFPASAYEIPSNWTGGQNQGVTSTHQAGISKKSALKSNIQTVPSVTAVPLMTTSSIVPPDPFLDVDHSRAGDQVVRRQSFSDSISTDCESVTPKTSASAKAKHNRERNREHARSTRLRKKAYVQKLKEMAEGLRAIQTEEIRQRRLAVHQMSEMQKTRKRLIHKFLHYHATYEQDPHVWAAIVEENFWLKQPVTPFRSFRRSEVERDCRVIRGIDAVICDAASVATMMERIGSRNARWQRIKRCRFERRLEQSGIHLESYQRVESSLSSSSGTESSDESLSQRIINKGEQLKNTALASVASTKKVSSSSGDSIVQRKRKSILETDENSNHSLEGQISASSEARSEPLQKILKTDGLPSNIAGSGGIVHNVMPVISALPSKQQSRNQQSRGDSVKSPSPLPHRLPPLKMVQLKERDIDEIGAYYAINEDDMIMIEDVLMCPFVFRSKNAVLCGALSDCVMPGMIRANFSKGNKLQSMEMVYDSMGLMQQLDGANGGQVTAEVIPGSLEMALMSSPDEARVITEAHPPFSVAHVNEAWTRLTKYTQVEVEGQGLLQLLEGERTDAAAGIRPGKPKHTLEDVARGISACSTNLHYDKFGNLFVDFMCSYPLTNSSDEISHLLHVNLELRKEHILI